MVEVFYSFVAFNFQDGGTTDVAIETETKLGGDPLALVKNRH